MPRVMFSVSAEARRGGHRLAPNHFRILKILSHKPSTPSELAKHLDVSLPSMSETVETLVQRGWLRRHRSERDRRVTDLRASARGLQVLSEEYDRVVQQTAERLEKLTPEELKKVEDGLDTLLHLFESEDPQAPTFYKISLRSRQLTERRLAHIARSEGRKSRKKQNRTILT